MAYEIGSIRGIEDEYKWVVKGYLLCKDSIVIIGTYLNSGIDASESFWGYRYNVSYNVEDLKSQLATLPLTASQKLELLTYGVYPKDLKLDSIYQSNGYPIKHLYGKDNLGKVFTDN
jgi:hypothetical protein